MDDVTSVHFIEKVCIQAQKGKTMFIGRISSCVAISVEFKSRWLSRYDRDWPQKKLRWFLLAVSLECVFLVEAVQGAIFFYFLQLASKRRASFYRSEGYA